MPVCEHPKRPAMSRSRKAPLTKMRLTGDGPPFVKVGARAVAYRKADLDAWLQARVRRSTSDAPTAPPTSARPLRPRGGRQRLKPLADATLEKILDAKS